VDPDGVSTTFFESNWSDNVSRLSALPPLRLMHCNTGKKLLYSWIDSDVYE
jgi:hypothetical protein